MIDRNSQLVNATVSQSVTEPVVLGVRSVAKVFIGDIIECARRVQAEWAEKLNEKQTDLPTPEPSPVNSPAVSGAAAGMNSAVSVVGVAAAGGGMGNDKPGDNPEATQAETTQGETTQGETTQGDATQADTQTDTQPDGQPETQQPDEQAYIPPAERTKHNRYGPLRPDHLREAMRRYKLSMEGGSVGMHCLWNLQQQNGVERFGIRTMGRRIFR